MTNRYCRFEVKSNFVSESFGSFSANEHVLDVAGEDITGDHQYIYPQVTSGRVKRNKVTGPKKFSGTIECPVFPREGTSLLYYSLGGITTITNTPLTNLNTHTIKKATTIPFFRTAIGRDQSEHRYVGGIINSTTLDYAPDELLMASFDVVYRRELTLGSLASPTFPDFNANERAFGGVEVGVEFNDVAVTFVESASITWENNVAADAYALGSAYLPAGIVAGLDMSGSMDLRYDSNARYTDFLAGTDIKLELLAAYGATTFQRKVNINCPVVSYDTNKLPTENLERYVQTLDFTPARDANGDPILITVVNTRTNAQMAG